MWQCFGIIIVIIMIIMGTQFYHRSLRERMTTLDICTLVWGAMCQQGTHLEIPTTSGRFIVMTSFLAGLAMFTSYSASIVAILQSPSHLIRDIDDLLASPLKMALQEAGYNRYNYLVENLTLLNRIYDQKILPQGNDGWIYDPFVGVEKIRTQLFAFQVESASAYKAIAETYTEDEKCGLSEIHVLRLAITTVTVERNSPYKELFKRRSVDTIKLDAFEGFKSCALLLTVHMLSRLRWQRENGLMNRAKRRWFPKKPDCEGEKYQIKIRFSV